VTSETSIFQAFGAHKSCFEKSCALAASKSIGVLQSHEASGIQAA